MAVYMESRADEHVRSSLPQVLVVEDDDALAEAISQLLGDEGFHVVTRPDAPSALDYAAAHEPAVILCDVHLRGMDVHSFLAGYRRTARPAASVILLSGVEDIVEIARREGADGYVRKPFDIEDLVREVRDSLALA